MAMAMLSVALAGDPDRAAELRRVPDWARQMLAVEEEIRHIAQRYRFMQHCVVIGRGFNYATAFEWSLKLKEMAYVVAEPYSSADFQHGPIAMVERGFPVMAVAPSGAVFDSILPMLDGLGATSRRADGNLRPPEALALAQSPVALRGIPEWLTPLSPSCRRSCSVTTLPWRRV
jgi:glucosamine--fructose-6-phosphate aminotransferase (isomerizing)